jgi:hypothetical protein
MRGLFIQPRSGLRCTRSIAVRRCSYGHCYVPDASPGGQSPCHRPVQDVLLTIKSDRRRHGERGGSVGRTVGPANLHEVAVLEREEHVMDRLAADLVEHRVRADRGWRAESM